MSPHQEQQLIALYIEVRIKQEAAREAADRLDLALLRAGNPTLNLKLVEPEKTPTPQTEEAKHGTEQ